MRRVQSLTGDKAHITRRRQAGLCGGTQILQPGSEMGKAGCGCRWELEGSPPKRYCGEASQEVRSAVEGQAWAAVPTWTLAACYLARASTSVMSSGCSLAP